MTAGVLLNGNVSVRERNSEHVTVMRCGCAFSSTTWLQLCADHWREFCKLNPQRTIDHELPHTQGPP